MKPFERKRLVAGLEFAGAAAVLTACIATQGEDVAGDDTAALSTCALSVTHNTYDGPNYWGTITIENASAASVTGISVRFDVPSGAHCTNDAVPPGAVLSPLSGSGTAAATSANRCTFTWSTRSLAAGASLTFNYSTDSNHFVAATNVAASASSCGAAPASGGTGGSASIGCNGAPGCAVWTHVYQTWYGFNDNSCSVESVHSCNDIAFPGLGPKRHRVATEGKGTFDDPITAAGAEGGCERAGGATLLPGTIVYNPEVHKYFIMEDSCLECTQECNCQSGADGRPPAGCSKDEFRHIDFWMGPNDSAQNAGALNDCEDRLTLGSPYQGPGTVIVNPPGNLPVDTRPIYVNNACTAHTYPDPP